MKYSLLYVQKAIGKHFDWLVGSLLIHFLSLFSAVSFHLSILSSVLEILPNILEVLVKGMFYKIGGALLVV